MYEALLETLPAHNPAALNRNATPGKGTTHSLSTVRRICCAYFNLK